MAHCRFGDHRQASCHGSVIDRLDAGLGEDPQRVGLAGGLDDPCQHQIPQNFVTTGRCIESEHLVGAAQGIPEMAGLRPDDLQRFAVDSGRIQPKIEGALAFGQALAGCGLERFELGVVVG